MAPVLRNSAPLVIAAACLLAAARLHAAESIQLDSDANLFAVLAAINAAGYDDGIDLPDNSPARKALRDYLAKENIPVLPELKEFYRRHKQKTGIQDLSQYISYALSIAGPPDFGWRTRDVEVPPDALPLSEFTPLLSTFYKQAHIADLWKDVQPTLDKEMAKYHSPLVSITNAVDGYLRVPSGGYLGRRFRVYIDLLGAPEQVQTRSYGDDTFVVVTPSETPRLFDLRHAYLHFQVDPIMIKYGMELQQKANLLDLVQTAPLDDNFKDDVVLLANESLIKTIETRLDKNYSAVAQAARQGYILAPFFAEQLPVFEKQEQGMRFYAADMVLALDVRRETARAKTIRFDAAALVRQSKQVTTAAPEPKLSPSGETLAKAEDLYTARKLDAAKDLYLKSLEQQGGADEHAQAWYGLARISVLQNDPDAAVKLFEKTLTASPDPQTEAWSRVYLARLAKAAGETETAAKFYREALAVKGASEKALDAARTESANLQK
jgi:tetratricopeptide (TPR) repeat protein